jgi:xanthine dehydrogenase iron-sulfur cluster and FAD-binding subunit A
MLSTGFSTNLCLWISKVLYSMAEYLFVSTVPELTYLEQSKIILAFILAFFNNIR